MDIKGFVFINSGATTCRGAQNPEEFIGQICRIMDINDTGDVLVLNPQATAMAMFDAVDVGRNFLCTIHGKVICPPNLDILGQMGYVTQCQMRKGGYNELLANMVIAASLARGEFTDSFLWQKQ